MLSRALQAAGSTRPKPAFRTCARFSYSQKASPNNDIIQLLTRNMEEENTRFTRNAYKVRAFKTAIKSISLLDHPIASAAEVRKLRGIGDGIGRRIEMYLSGTQDEASFDDDAALEKQEQKRYRQAMKEIRLVSGIGPTTAKQLFDAGCTSIEEMRNERYQNLLTNAQKISVRFHEHLRRPISPLQSETVLQFITENTSSRFDLHLTGSYRRGAQESSDLDILILHPSVVYVPTPSTPSAKPKRTMTGRHPVAFRGGSTDMKTLTESILLNEIVKPLENRGIIAATSSLSPQKWQGVIRIPERDDQGAWEDKHSRLERLHRDEGIFCRMDLNLVPQKSRGAAFLALTGDAEFNRSLRQKATGLGMLLNEYGLWRWQSDKEDSLEGISPDAAEQAKGRWMFVEGESEAEILKQLGVEYVEPEKRNFLLDRSSKSTKKAN